jgi:hypothetical protein
LQHNSYIEFVRDEILPHAWMMLVLEHKRVGRMIDKVSINSIILRNIWISVENFTPYSNWVVDKEVITKRCFWFRVDAQRSLWNLWCETPQCMDKKG